MQIMLKPLIKWSGGKVDEINELKKYIPEYETFIEPFVGGGALFFNQCPTNGVISDLHSDLINFYREIQKGNAQLIYDFMDNHPNKEETYYYVRDKMQINNELEQACRFYYLRKTCYRGMLRYNNKGNFNIPFGKYKKINYENLLNEDYYSLLRRTTILNEDFEEVFKRYNSSNNFVFLDPPYDSKFSDYGLNEFNQEKHKKLSECFKQTENKCLLVIGYTDFIYDLYKDYIVDEYQKKYRFKIHSGRVNVGNKHLIIKNY